MTEIRVLIADDHAFYREGVRGMLRPLSDSFAIVGEASDGAAETMRHARNDLATVAPDWLRAHRDPAWSERYVVRVEEYRLPHDAATRHLLVEAIGQDGYALLRALAQPTTPVDLPQRRALQALRRIWMQQYDGPHDLRWRTSEDLPPHALLIPSPYAVAARFATKRETSWTGYTVHRTETCDEDSPHLITTVETTPATTNDVCVTDTIHAHLAERDLLPHAHLLDSGYVAADVLVASQQQHVDVVGPVLRDNSWQARQPDGLDVRCFAIDWQARQVTCPAGKVSRRWTPGRDEQGLGQAVIAIQCEGQDCGDCQVRPRGTQAKDGPRTMKLRPREQHEALQSARQRQTTAAFKQLYAGRAGIEGTLSQGVRAFGLRYARYRGQAKTHVQHILIAVAITIVRVVAWIWEVPQATTRTSPVARFVATLS